MVKKFKFLKLLSLLVLVSAISCQFLDNRRKYRQINSNIELNLEVNSVRIENTFILNEQYYCEGVYFLFENKKDYDFIFQKEFLDNDYLHGVSDYGEINLGIGYIQPPYKLFKKKNSNILYLVKSNDTLKSILP